MPFRDRAVVLEVLTHGIPLQRHEPGATPRPVEQPVCQQGILVQAHHHKHRILGVGVLGVEFFIFVILGKLQCRMRQDPLLLLFFLLALFLGDLLGLCFGAPASLLAPCFLGFPFLVGHPAIGVAHIVARKLVIGRAARTIACASALRNAPVVDRPAPAGSQQRGHQCAGACGRQRFERTRLLLEDHVSSRKVDRSA